MAVVTALKGNLDTSTLGLDRSTSYSSISPTRYTLLYSDHVNSEFGGHFKVYPQGWLTGVMRSLTGTVHGEAAFTMTNFKADAYAVQSRLFHGSDAAAYLLNGDDRITGGDRADTLYGHDGNDRIGGGDGGALIVGGAGGVRLTGGGGADTFLYLAALDSTPGSHQRDVILDFSHRQGDTIDLSRLDADVHAEGQQHFTFVDAFSGEAGELLVKEVASGWLVQGEIDGQDGVDFAILVKSVDGPPVATDFVL